MFENRKLVVATKHRKETVIAPILEKELGVICFVDETFDTDTLGTFTGDVERKLDPISAAREKCLQAIMINDCELGIASEGSFGPHPSMFFVSADEEVLIFIDKKNNLEIIAREISIETNYNGKELKTENDLIDFSKSIGFPAHGLILRKSKDDMSEIHKGIADLEILKATFRNLHHKYRSVYAETDMRALYNPTRMKVIKKAAEKLVEKIKSACPSCQMRGFWITQAKKGLKCSLCGLPTNSTLSYIYQCQHCNFTREDLYPNKKKSEDPMYCNYCNP
jgi:hypothetical protein